VTLARGSLGFPSVIEPLWMLASCTVLASEGQRATAPPRWGLTGGHLCLNRNPRSPDQSGLCGAVACPPSIASRGWEGRVEHVVSGQVTHLHSLEELLAFIRRVLPDVQPP